MSEIKTNKIKPALNPTKVTLKTGLSVVDPVAQSNDNKSFEVNTKGQIELNRPLFVGNAAGLTTGYSGQVLLSRGKNSTPMWGPIPNAVCPPVSDIGQLWYCAGLGDRSFFPSNAQQTTLYTPVNVTNTLSQDFICDSNNFRTSVGNLEPGGAIDSSGNLWLWGINASGRVGNGSKSSIGAFTDTSNWVYTPTKVGTLGNWSSVLSTPHATLATKNDGTMWVWGSNQNAIYGNGTYQGYSVFASTFYYLTSYPGGQTIIPSVEPVRFGTDTNWKKVGSITHTKYQWSVGWLTYYALKTDGTIWSWGLNDSASGGIASSNSANSVHGYQVASQSQMMSPRQIGTDTDWVDVGGSRVMGWGIKADGSLWMWGRKAYMGTGLNPTNSSVQITPMKVSGPGYGNGGRWKKFINIDESCYGLQEDGSIWVWGFNRNGERLGLGTINPISGQPWSNTYTYSDINVFLPYPVRLDNNTYLDIAPLSDSSSVLIRTDGSLWIIGSKFGPSSQPGGPLGPIGYTPTAFSNGITQCYSPLEPNWSKTIVWSKIQTGSFSVTGIGTEKIVAPQGTVTKWIRRGYTSLSQSPCSSSSVGVSTDDVPDPPGGWVYCDGKNGTINMKSWVNPIDGKLDFPPLDNANGCGDSSGNLSGQITYIQKI